MMLWPVALAGAWMVVVAVAVRSVVIDGNWVGVPFAACFLWAIVLMAREYRDLTR